jgi:hypothetical protein
VFNEQIIIEETTTVKPTTAPFSGYFTDMKDYYRYRLCDFRLEMRARQMDLPSCINSSVIPSNLKQLEPSWRYNRDYCIIRDTQKIVRGYEELFNRIYVATVNKPARK